MRHPPFRLLVAVLVGATTLSWAAAAGAQQAAMAQPSPIVLPTGPAAPRSPDAYQQMAHDILKELVETNTTASVGNEMQAANGLKRRFLAAGFPEEDIFVGGPDDRQGNIVVRLRGRRSDLKPILLLAHLDVVEADPADWTLPPFQLIERNGGFYGRGTDDDKDEVAIYATNLIRMKQEGDVPERDIVGAFTADEEGGGSNGVRWLLQNHKELIDAALALNEGGGGLLAPDGHRVSNWVQASEKKFGNVLVEAVNPGGHSSLPRPDNAIYDLARALDGISKYHFPVRLNEVTRAFLEAQAPLEPPEMGAAMRALLVNEHDEAAGELLSEDPLYNSTLRTTCVATLLEGGHASNALPQRATATVNCRMLPDEDPANVERALQRAAGPNVKVSLQGNPRANPPSPLTSELMETVERVTTEMWPSVPVVPRMSTGATDGLALRGAGIPTYGISGLFYPEDSGMHGMNERIPQQSFYEGQEFLYRLVKALTTTPMS